MIFYKLPNGKWYGKVGQWEAIAPTRRQLVTELINLHFLGAYEEATTKVWFNSQLYSV